MTSREIAEITGKLHKNVMAAIREMEPAWVKITGLNFQLSEYTDPTGRKLPQYELSKKECLYIGTKFNDEARAKLINRWEQLELEKQNNKLPDFSNPAEAARAWADEFEAKQLAETKVKELTPKADGYDQFLDTSSYKSMKEAANTLGYGRNKFMGMLRKMGFLTSHNLPYQRFIDSGHFTVKQSVKNGMSFSTAFVTAKGVDYLKNHLFNIVKKL